MKVERRDDGGKIKMEAKEEKIELILNKKSDLLHARCLSSMKKVSQNSVKPTHPLQVGKVGFSIVL